MNQRGNILFLILLAVVLFAALSYAVTSSTQGGGADASSEIAELEAARQADYITLIQNTALRLEMVQGCSSIDYTPPEDQTPGDKSCHMFHPDGGGVGYQEFGLNGCDLAGIEITDLEIGEGCGSLVYAGSSGGNRLYTTASDQSSNDWNNNTSSWGFTGAASWSNGLENTNTLVDREDSGAPYRAAGVCRALGSEWYLPARAEIIDTLYTHRATIGGFSSDEYWSSTEDSGNSSNAYVVDFSDASINKRNKNSNKVFRCVRQ